MHNGIEEYELTDKTRIDCLTDEYAIDNKWAELIGQALHYSIQSGKKPKVVLILVFAYNENYKHKAGNPIEWLRRTVLDYHESAAPQDRTSFLRKFAIDHDIPMFIFGD